MPAVYIHLEQDLDFAAKVDGTALEAALDELDELAESLGIAPLSGFFGIDQESFAALSDGSDEDAPEEQWFEASEGLASLDVLLQALEDDPQLLDDSDEVIEDLEDCYYVLEQADQHDSRWYLAVDF